MAADNITVENNRWATVEADENKYVLTLNQMGKCNLMNVGDQTVYLSDELAAGDLNRDGLQRVGEIPLAPGDSFPLPEGLKKMEFQCGAGLTSTMILLPLRA